MKQPELAIILPAWKSKFLERSLRSIENQEAGSFRLYIFDDAGPQELAGICRPFLERNPDWHYHRFDQNLGKENLAAHWNRCIRRSSEEWVWLFSDDDEMEPGSVEAFLDAKATFPEQRVFRLPFSIMDEEGELQPAKTLGVNTISGAEFGKQRFLRNLDSSAVEFIFSRSAFEEQGGFPEFPAAWCSDDAAWIKFSGKAGIRFLKEGGVRWRSSSLNISGSGGSWTLKKLEAAIQFIAWYNKQFPEAAADASFRAEQIIWLRLQMVHQHYFPGLIQVLRMLKKLEIRSFGECIRSFQDLYCLSYVYHCRVVAKKKPAGIRYWLSILLPAF